MSSDDGSGGSEASDGESNKNEMASIQDSEATEAIEEIQNDISLAKQRSERLLKLQNLQAKSKIRITFTLTLKDEVKILLYNLLEPVFMALLMFSSVTLVQIGTTAYFALVIFIMYPLLLTLNETWIRIKLGLSITTAVLAIAFTLMKAWIYCQFTVTEHVNASPELLKAIGIYQGQWTKTFLVDIVVFVVAAALIPLYVSQIEQARLRRDNQNNLRFQYGINLVHPCLGNWLKPLIIIAYSLLLVDTFFYQSLIQMIILLVINIYIYKFAQGQKIVVSEKVLRVIQLSLYIVLLTAVILRFPGVVIAEKSRVLQIIGVETLTVQTSRQQWYLGIHWFLISNSLTQSEMFFVMQRVVKPKKTTYLEVITEPQGSILKKDRLDTEDIDEQTVVIKQTQKRKNQRITLAEYWQMLRLPCLLWVCRISCLMQAFRYHDWQSSIPLIWVLHSALFQERSTFCKVTLYFYLPMLMLIQFFYFITNVYGVIDFDKWQSEGRFPHYYRLGFFYMQNPEIDFAGLFFCVTVIALYCRLNRFERYKKRSLLANLQRFEPLYYSWFYLLCVNQVYLVQLYAVIFGLITTDLYHILVLCAMVIAQFQELKYKRHAVWLIAYVNFFILAKYITSLVYKSGDNPYNLIIGFSSTYFVPASESREFYRYVPPVPSFVLLFAFGLQYRCFCSLGHDEKIISKKCDSASDMIAHRQPNIYKLYKTYKVFENHAVVIVTFLLYMIIILLMQRSFINSGSLFIVLMLLARYLQTGLKALIASWSIIAIYQAAVLLTLISLNFVLYTKKNSTLIYPRITNKWEGLSDYTKALWQYAGFYEFTGVQWKALFPYVFLCFYAIMVKSKFEQKLYYDEKDVSHMVAPTAADEDEASAHDLSYVAIDDDEPRNQEAPDENAELAAEVKRKQEVFQIETKYMDMKFKMQYLVWKSRAYWPIFDSVSLNFNIVFITYVLGCALYYSIAGIWFLFMLIFVLQNWAAQRAHRQYQRDKQAEFMKKEVNLPSDDGWFGTSHDRMTTSASVARLEKLESQLVDCKDKETQDLLKHQISQALAVIDDDMRTIFTDEEAIEEYDRYRKEVKYVTLISRHYFWMTQFYLTILSTFCIYLSAFLVTPVSDKNPVTLIPADWNQGKVIFIVFWSGFYQQVSDMSLSGGSYFKQYWVYFVLLYMLISEKLCQQWLTNRFQTSDQLIAEFQSLTEQYEAIHREAPAAEVTNTEDPGRPSHTVAEKTEQEQASKDKIIAELTPRLFIKYKLNTQLSLRFIIDEIAITLIFFSMVYKQNIYSFILFGVIVWYLIAKYRNYGSATVAARYTVVTVILLQYLMALTNLSSYNSPRDFPTNLTNSTLPSGETSYTVYPNVDQMYFGVPWYFNVTKQTYFSSTYNQTVPMINNDVCNFFGISVSGRTLNGMWIDFLVVVLMYIYLNNAGLWLLEIPYKVYSSQKTLDLVSEYQKLQKVQNPQPTRQYKNQILASMTTTRTQKVIQQWFLVNWGLVLIAFLVLSCVSGQSVVSFGYFIFGMVLVIFQFNFYRYPEYRDRQIFLLKYVLTPYILLDVLTGLLYQMPLQSFTTKHEWIYSLGLVKIWTYKPTDLFLGQIVIQPQQLDEYNKEAMDYLFLRGVLYLLIAVQLQILNSQRFLKLYDKQLCGSTTKHYKIALGTAYRFNNFKNAKLREQAESYSTIDKMLRQVKLLLKQKAFMVESKAEDLPEGDLPRETQEEQLFQLIQAEEPLEKEFEREVSQLYKKKLDELSWLHHAYISLNETYVNDMLFSHTDEHLSAMLKHHEQGHTSCKTRLEIGLMIEAKREWLDQKTVLLREELGVGVISGARYKEYQEFRDNVSLRVEPWERYDLASYKSYWTLAQNYVIIVYKILMSNLQCVSYVFMLLSLMFNGGLLYMVYPALVFGIALVEEWRPSKTYWYFVVCYTQALLVLQLLAQLNIFNRKNLNGQGTIFEWSDKHNIGILSRNEYTGSYGSVFWILFPELMLLITTLATIQYETILGIFDVNLYDFEQFTDSLKRLSIQTTEVATHQKQIQNIERQELLSAGIQMKPLARKRSLSEADKFNRQASDREVLPSLVQKLLNGAQPQDLNETIADFETENLYNELITTQIKVDYLMIDRRRCKSIEYRVKQEEEQQRLNLLQQGMREAQQMTEVFWQNSLFNRLFPSIKQQKPGSDYYAWTMFFQVCIVLYIILFTHKMSGENDATSLAFQFSGNQINEEMVLSLIIMIVIMVVDRVFYSTETKVNRKMVDQKLGTDKGLTSESSTAETEQENSFHDWLTVPQYQGIWPRRVLRYYWLWFLLFLVHWYVFFELTNQIKVCYGHPYCNSFPSNGYLIVFYLLFCVYFALTAIQIKSGLPELKKGGLFVDHYDVAHKTAYYVWYYIPFLFELRTIIDWTFTRTALDVFQSIELAKVQSDLYVAKCYNRTYMYHRLGEKISWIEKVLVGLSLMLFILFLIAGPMLLFSNINPISNTNLVSESSIQFSIKIDDAALNTTALVPLYFSSSLIRNKTLTSEQFDAMDFDAAGSSSALFSPYQCQAIQYSSIPDTVWRVSPPKRKYLTMALNEIASKPMTLKTATAQLTMSFKRATLASLLASYQWTMDLNFQQQQIINSLVNQLDCLPNATATEFPNTVDLAVSLNQNKYAYPMNQVVPVYSGFIMKYNCNEDDVSQNFWSIEQSFNQTISSWHEENQLFETKQGFGIFSFNQNVLPDIFAGYSSSVLVFYIAIVYVIATAFRSAFVPLSYEVFIINAPYTEDILMICQSIYVYRIQRNLRIEEELFMILVDVMRSPETIKRLCKTSLKDTTNPSPAQIEQQ